MAGVRAALDDVALELPGNFQLQPGQISEDRRYLTVTLTESGETLIRTVFSDVESAIVAEMGSLTSEEQETLGMLCKKLGLP